MRAPIYLNAMPSTRPSVLNGIITALVTAAELLRDHGMGGDEGLSNAEHEVSQTNSIEPRRRKPRHHPMDKGELRNA